MSEKQDLVSGGCGLNEKCGYEQGNSCTRTSKEATRMIIVAIKLATVLSIIGCIGFILCEIRSMKSKLATQEHTIHQLQMQNEAMQEIVKKIQLEEALEQTLDIQTLKESTKFIVGNKKDHARKRRSSGKSSEVNDAQPKYTEYFHVKGGGEIEKCNGESCPLVTWNKEMLRSNDDYDIKDGHIQIRKTGIYYIYFQVSITGKYKAVKITSSKGDENGKRIKSSGTMVIDDVPSNNGQGMTDKTLEGVQRTKATGRLMKLNKGDKLSVYVLRPQPDNINDVKYDMSPDTTFFGGFMVSEIEA